MQGFSFISAIFRTASGRLQAIAGVGAGRGGGGRCGDSLCGVQCRWREGGGGGEEASFNLLLALLCLTNTILSSQTVSGGKRHLES